MRSILKIALMLCVVPAFAFSTAFAQSAELNTYHRLIKAGAEQLKQGDHRAALGSFEEALRYVDTEPTAYLGLGMAFFHLREDGKAERALKRALELNPKEKTAYQVLGDLSYRRDDLESALSYWEKAVELDQGDEQLRKRLDRLRLEHRTEKDFNRDVTSHFTIKYEGRERIEAGRIVLKILEDSYGDIGKALAFYPDREIQVILYSDRQFQEVTNAPGWSGAVFDGKIRIPIGGVEQETPGLRALLYHEYTHAVVRAIAARVPTWLNEGLAQYFEGREVSVSQREALKRLSQAGKLPALATLEGSFMGYGGDQAGYAYLISLSAVRYLIDQHGLYRVKMVLEELAKGADGAAAVSAAILVSFEEFEADWKKSLE
jgi:tetratricopeptide (TPR) repeat protein